MTAADIIRLDLWPGAHAEFSRQELSLSAIPVKGVSYHSPLRFLEIFGNERWPTGVSTRHRLKDERRWQATQDAFFPTIPSTVVRIGEDVPQPPFPWRDASPWHLCISFTYNTNALYRILSLLSEDGRIAAVDIDRLVDRACQTLARLYRERGGYLLKNINNNFNMFLISKVIERIVGRDRYDVDLQELARTRRALHVALTLAKDHVALSAVEKMGVAVGAGVTFIESRLTAASRQLSCSQNSAVQDIVSLSHGRSLAIDHRATLFDMVDDGCCSKGRFVLAVILDDATETVDDLLWMQDLCEMFDGFVVHLLVNTAQVSVNFSAHMLCQVLADPSFAHLAAKFGSQLKVTEMYCPFISFQTNYLQPAARRVIDDADAVYVKGANFFETCQIRHKHTFHGFTVLGGVSRSYTGLDDQARVFAHVPAGKEGFVHNRKKEDIVTLDALVGSTR